MTHGRIGILVALSLLVLPASGWAELKAQDALPPSNAVQGFMVEQNVYPAVEKLGRGLGNALTCWMELPLAMKHRYNPNSPTTAAASMVTGFLWGLTGTVVRAVVGVYETGTFFIPIPERFAAILPPLERLECAPDAPKAPCH